MWGSQSKNLIQSDSRPSMLPKMPLKMQLISRLILVSGLGAMACGAPIEVIDDCECGYYITTDGQSVTWDEGTQIRFRFDSRFPAEAKEGVKQASTDFNSILARTQLRLAPESTEPLGGRSPNQLSGDGINGIYWMEDSWPWEDDGHTAAMTVVTFSHEAKIIEADIYFRASMYTTRNSASQLEPISQTESNGEGLLSSPTIVPNSNLSVRWVYLLAAHEMGHALGLVHSKHAEAIMYPSVGNTQSSRREALSDLDINVLGEIYQLK